MTAVVPPASSAAATPIEYFDVLNEIGAKTGIVKLRSHVHRDGEPTSPCTSTAEHTQGAHCAAGDWHRSVHVWVYAQNTDSLLIQKRAACKDSWPNLWDVSAAGHGMQCELYDGHLMHAAQHFKHCYAGMYKMLHMCCSYCWRPLP